MLGDRKLKPSAKSMKKIANNLYPFFMHLRFVETGHKARTRFYSSHPSFQRYCVRWMTRVEPGSSLVSSLSESWPQIAVEVPFKCNGDRMSMAHHSSSHLPPVFWTKEATLLLIDLYKRNEGRFNSGVVRKKLIWKEIANTIQRHGNPFTWEQCEGRWKTLTAAYRRAILHNRVSQFHKELGEVMGFGVVPSPHLRSIAPKPVLNAAGASEQTPLFAPGLPQTSSSMEIANPATSNGGNLVACSNATSSNNTNQNGLPSQHVPLGAPVAMNMSSLVTGAMPVTRPRRKRQLQQQQWNYAGSDGSEVINWLTEFEGRQERRSREFMDKLEKMHSEKLAVVSELISTIKEVAQ